MGSLCHAERCCKALCDASSTRADYEQMRAQQHNSTEICPAHHHDCKLHSSAPTESFIHGKGAGTNTSSVRSKSIR